MLTYDDTAPAIEARAIVKVFGEGDTEVRALEGVDTFSRAARRAGNE